ncbi:MAG: CapA family protein [Oscillospiraceae bacterium]|nr:CapA family protein [Oscillospiraceae bacterium]
MNANKLRSAYWDNIKGFLIILTVFAHCLYEKQFLSSINTIVDGIYMFHMPAFVFVSGYFGKSERSHSFFSIVKLLFAYFIFDSIVSFIYDGELLIVPIYSYWYLLALVVWRLTAHRIAKFKEIQLILLVIALFAGFYSVIDNTFAAARIIGFYPFYMAGYKLSEEKSDSLVSKSTPKKLGFGLLSIFGAILVGTAAVKICYLNDDSFLMFSYNDPIEAFGRIGIFAASFLAIYAIRCLSPNKNIPLLTAFGRNSLVIFLFHRPFTLIFQDVFRIASAGRLIAYAAVCTLLICLVFGNDFFTGFVNDFLDAGAEIFTGHVKSRRKLSYYASRTAFLVVSLCFIGQVVISSYAGVSFGDNSDPESDYTVSTDPIYSILSDEKQSQFDSAFRITFAGDLICLEDQVKRAYTDDGYNFDDVFEYAKPHISSADLAIGVFEGPMAGEAAGYSSSNFNDEKELYLNYPDEFAAAVKNAGFDIVTTATNHVLDKGPEGVERTLDVLDKTGLDHTGSYRNAAEKESSNIKIIEQNGLKFALLSYTYGSNYHETSNLAEGDLSYISSFISGTHGELFDKLKASVIKDFEKAKEYNPDFIVVLPHIGTQFSNESNSEQETWFEIFKECGADIILGDHAHSVQPVSIDDYCGSKVFTAYCPGNFANIYRENQGDASALIDVYIDIDSKEIIGGGIVPLYTQSPADGNYRALPIFEIQNNKTLRSGLSTDDCEKAAEAHSIITKVMLGSELDMSAATESYLFDESGYLRQKTTGLSLNEKMKSSALCSALSNAESVCFVGDSLTEGTKNGGCPWYEPIEEFIPSRVLNYSKGGSTVSYFTERSEEIPEADLYVIAVGTNDVRYRDKSCCAMSADIYSKEINLLRNKLLDKSPDAEFVFIAPWYSIDGDLFCDLSFKQKTKLNIEYCDALESLCIENEDIYVNPNEYIKHKLDSAPTGTYLLDHIHPNSTAGVIMYSEAVLSSAAEE